MIDLDEIERQYAPFKEVPVCFVEYPQVNKLCAAVPLLIEELRAAADLKEDYKKALLDILNRNQTLSQFVQLAYIDTICKDELIKLNRLEVNESK